MARYPLEFGWHTDAKDDTPEIPTYTPGLPTLLGGAGLDAPAQQSPIQLAQASGPADSSDDDNELIFDTVHPEAPIDPTRHNGWLGNWLLKNPSKTGGYVVQKVTHTLPGPGNRTATYWEAWRIEPGQRRTTRYQGRILPTTVDDTFAAPGKNPLATKGTHRFDAEARYYPGLQLPGTFKPFSVPEVGELLGTETRPEFWTDSAPRKLERGWQVDPDVTPFVPYNPRLLDGWNRRP